MRMTLHLTPKAIDALDDLVDKWECSKTAAIIRLLLDTVPPPAKAPVAETAETKPMKGAPRRAAEKAMPDVIVIKRASDGLPLPYLRVPGGYRSPVGYSSAMPTTPAPVSKLYERDWVPYDPDNPEHRDLPLTEAEARLTKYGQ